MAILYFLSKKRCKVQCEACLLERECQVVNAKRSLNHNGKTLCKNCFHQQKDYKENMSRVVSGENNGFYNKTHSDETRQKLSKALTGRFAGEKNCMFGKTHSTEAKKKISKKLKGKLAGAKNPNWRGGITKLRSLIHNSDLYQEWRAACMKRDGFKCVFCSNPTSGILEVDHIKPFAIILLENNIKTKEDAEQCAVLWDIQNGRTLCVKCHMQTDTWGQKTKEILNQHKTSDNYTS